ncbi:hypothetical protein Q7P37_005292 [Cladosporium fusiforme]
MAEQDWSKALYGPLPLSGTQLRTRFLRILKGRQGDALKCKLFTSTLVSTKYEALSYTWGTDARNIPLSVNGIAVGVTQNLLSALFAMRQPTSSRVIWVDAICINQEDIRERSHQVQQMGDIYRCAHRVILWIGEASDDCKVLFRLIQMPPSDHLTYLSQDLGELDSLLGLQCLSNPRFGGQLLNHEKLSFLRRNMGKMVDDLIGRRYWTRVWIVQEIARAKSNPLVLCGDESIDWSKLAEYASKTSGMQQINLLQAIRVRVRTPPRLRFSGNRVPRPSVVRASYEDDLFYFLDRTRDFDATDPRDKIFALLNMTRGLSAQVATADYEQPVESVFIDLARTAMSRSLSLDITSYKSSANPSELTSGASNLPSWVPDFSRKRKLPVPRFELRRIYSSGSVDIEAIQFWTDHEGNNVLSATGLGLAEITSVASVPFLHGAPSQNQQADESIASWEHIAASYQKQMESRVALFLDGQRSSEEFSLPPNVMQIAEALFLLHVRMHHGDETCHSAGFPSHCTRNSLESILTQELDLHKFLQSQPYSNQHGRFHLRGAGNSPFAMLSLLSAVMKRNDGIQELEVPTGSRRHYDLFAKLERSHFYLEDFEHATLLRFCGLLQDNPNLPREPCQWQTSGSLAVEALGRVACCDQFLEEVRSLRMVETDAGVLGFATTDTKIQPGDEVVFFDKTASLKVVRRVPGNDTEERRFELRGDVYLHWPDMERAGPKAYEDRLWQRYALV